MHHPKSIFTGHPTNTDIQSQPIPDQDRPNRQETLNGASEARGPPDTSNGSSFRVPSWPLRSPLERHPLRHGRQLSPTSSPFNPDSHVHISPTKKRSLPQLDPAPSVAQPSSAALHKRRRLTTCSRHTIDPFSFPGPSFGRDQPPSPLFFSNNTRKRPHLPPRFSSSEAAARMLSKTQNEDCSIKTVKLARGTFSGASPPGNTSYPGSRGSIDRSPEARERHETPLRILGSISVVELFEQDGRPTFIVDIGDASNYAAGPLQIVFANSALRNSAGVLEHVMGRSSGSAPDSPAARSFRLFKAWILGSPSQSEIPDPSVPAIAYAGFRWTYSTLRRRLRLASGTFAAGSPSPFPSATATANSYASNGELLGSSGSRGDSSAHDRAISAAQQNEPDDYFGDVSALTAEDPGSDHAQTAIVDPGDGNHITTIGFNGKMLGRAPDMGFLDIHPSFTNECVLRAATGGDVDSFLSDSPSKEIGFFDWTRLPLTEILPRHIKFARSIDWASTPLGPIERWSADLRQMCNLIMASPHPAAMYWGEELVAIYNEAYVLLAGQKHPKLMGQRYCDAWAEIWDEVKDVFASARQTGQATMKDDDCLFIKRNEYLEETYFSWSIIPMVGSDGTVMGLYNPAFEKTRRKIAERRMLTLREVGERTANARDVKSFWEAVLGALDTNAYDTPFVLLYSVSDENDSDSSSIHSSSLLGTKQCFLEGSLGVPPGHPVAPEQLELKVSMEGFGPVFREVMKTDKPAVIEIGTGDLPAEMMVNLEWRGFGDPCRSVVVCPIHPTTGESILGFLVMGVNPRRPYDDDYSLFVGLLSRQLATSLASVVLFEEEIRRGQRAAKLAALDRIELSQQLAARTREAEESETKFTRMAEFSPAGLFIANSEGHITYSNDTWYEISRVPRDSESLDRWIDSVKKEDQALVTRLWNDLIEKTEPMTAEFRFKAPWEDRNGSMGDTWVLLSAYPEKNECGILKSVFGVITNISQQKWAEGFQKRKMEEAIELKRQQENFIDITSHEMRNPLSAILQCADEIATSLGDFRSCGQHEISPELVTNSIDAAQTIALCAQHQKRIVDDVLTLSKLDSAMLLVTPVEVQPLEVVQRALRMFEGELQTADIQMKFIVDESFKQLGIDWVKLDPSRVLQVLINLTTNAIKFTTTESKRTITVTVAAYLQRPSVMANRIVNYFPSRSKRIDINEEMDWGDGEEVYVQFAVQDTGRGLNEEEKKLLFLRFSQASPRTHVQYGGSGLGLFISRELTELQGGEIGVASEAGKGSTFAFYIKARRTAPPKDPTETQLPLVIARQPSDPRPKAIVEPVVKTKDFALATANQLISSEDGNSLAERKALKVLIVEDNLVNQRVLQKQLRNYGFTVHVANHGGEALDQLRESQYWHEHGPDAIDLSVVLMDQEMPVMDGLQCTRRIRELEESRKLVRHVPIIAVTANARTQQIEALLAAGMDDVVSKPFRIPDLVPKIEELAARYAPSTQA